ncbi:hypothetical protein ACIPSJ_01650 [Streptomyces sp. NPDC090088]|uniref:hypothetical protein n=1 Tax=Streptomyces sp. NPDC090088 TaxID=3365944 RepID=UPI003818C88E
MSPALSPDTAAILHAAEALTAQLRRIADAVASPYTDEAATTSSDSCQSVDVDGTSVLVRGSGDLTEQDQEFFAEVVRAAKRRYETDHPPAAVLDAQRASRRASLTELLDRNRGVGLNHEQTDLLQRHVEAEIREADAARAEAERQERMGLSAIRGARKLLESRAARQQQRVERAEAEAQRWLSFIARGMATHTRFGVLLPDGSVEELPCADWCYACRLEHAEAERDGAYRERNALVALLAGYTDGAVVAPAPDVEDPGWQIVYLQLDDHQASWHFGPRDADLAHPIEHVSADDPRAQWDGHTTEAKYAHITALTAELLRRCGPACAEQHTETGRCVVGRDR